MITIRKTDLSDLHTDAVVRFTAIADGAASPGHPRVIPALPGFAFGRIICLNIPDGAGEKTDESRLIRDTYQEALKLAVENGFASVGFPSPPARYAALPPDAAWDSALSACVSFLEKNAGKGPDIVFAAPDDDAYHTGHHLLITFPPRYWITDAAQQAMEDLNEALFQAVSEYLDTVDSSYDFWFAEADAPDEADIKDTFGDLEGFIDKAVQQGIYGPERSLSKKFNESVPGRIRDMILKTLRRNRAELLDLSPSGWEKYGEEARENWMDLIHCMVRVPGEKDHWYIFRSQWSD